MSRAGAQTGVCRYKWDTYITPLSQEASDTVGAPISTKELGTAINKLKKYTAPGPTGETPEMLAWLDQGNQDHLLKLVNEVVVTSTTPKAWKHASLHMIF